jgi:hypothetical protein
MNSKTTDSFRKAFVNLPKEIKAKAKSKFILWKDNPNQQSLRFKQVHNSKPIYSIRISIGYRALGVRVDDTIVWFWIGSHSDYDKYLKNL